MKILLSLIIFSISLLINKADDFDYRYQSKWYDLNEECSFRHQSPIELSSDESILAYDIPKIQFENYDVPYAKPAQLSNNGHTANIQLPKPNGYIGSLWQIYDKLSPAITGGPLPYGRFVTETVHFHWGSKDAHGSEHVIDSQRYSMEMHIVHRNSKYATVEEAKLHADGLAVLAVLYHVKPTQLTNFMGLDNIINSLAAIKEFNKTSEIENFTLSKLFGDMATTEFFTYQGSLTTPPCSEAVTWIVFQHEINISHAQMKRFRLLSDGHGEVLENNYRHLQSKGMRQVYLRQKRKVIDGIIHSPALKDILDKLKPQPFQQNNGGNANAPMSNNI